MLLVQKLLNSALMGGAGNGAGKSSLAALSPSICALGSIPPFESLKEDGSIGAKTVAAIVWFQKNILDMSKPDGVVKADGKTFQTLVNPPVGHNSYSVFDNYDGESGTPTRERGVAITGPDEHKKPVTFLCNQQAVSSLSKLESVLSCDPKLSFGGCNASDVEPKGAGSGLSCVGIFYP